MGSKGGYRDIMTGKPRRKKGETLEHYRERVVGWANENYDEPPADKTEPEPTCGTCYHWGDNNQCFRYPKIVVTTERHRCGEHKAK